MPRVRNFKLTPIQLEIVMVDLKSVGSVMVENATITI